MRYIIISRNTDYLDLVKEQMDNSREEYGVLTIEEEYPDFASVITARDTRAGGYIVVVLEEINRYLERLVYKLMQKNIFPVYIIKQYVIQKQLSLSLEDFSAGYYIDNWDKPFLAHAETHIIDYCNLNCKACNNFSPFFKKGCVASLENFEKDLKCLKDKFSAIGRLYLLGGEPLLDSDRCIEFVKMARTILPFTEIRLISNGLLIPRINEKFWEVLYDCKIVVQITQYPPTVKLLDEIKYTLDRHQIMNVISDEVKYFVKRWTLRDEEDAEYNNIHCGSAGCHYFRDGKVYKCPDIGLVKQFDNYFGTDIYYEEGIDIAENNGREILNALMLPAKMCSKCCIKRSQLIKWEPIGRELKKEDWLLPDEEEIRRKCIEISSGNLICFGTGECFSEVHGQLASKLPIYNVCDNDPEKWGTLIEGINCISPGELGTFDDPCVIVTAKNPEIIFEIESQLEDMGIKKHMTVFDFLYGTGIGYNEYSNGAWHRQDLARQCV